MKRRSMTSRMLPRKKFLGGLWHGAPTASKNEIKRRHLTSYAGYTSLTFRLTMR